MTPVEYIEKNFSTNKTLGELKIIIAQAKEMEKQKAKYDKEKTKTKIALLNDMYQLHKNRKIILKNKTNEKRRN
jgi:hypothetical protein